MPRRIDWCEKAINQDTVGTARVLDERKTLEITHSNSMMCVHCHGAQHKMRYRLLNCSSALCMEQGLQVCAWRGKTLMCLETGTQSVYDCRKHISSISSPRTKRVPSAQKDFCREMATHHLRSVRIRHTLTRKFDKTLESLPDLRTVQNFVNYYSRKYLENHGRVDSIKEMQNNMEFTGSQPQSQAFSFGWEMDGEGNLVVGNGSDQRPFITGITTKALLLRMDRPPASFVFHIDATYKTNHCDYPTESVFEAALLALKRIFGWVAEKELRLHYPLAHADQAQYNAPQKSFGDYGNFQFLMCFYDMHFARSLGEFVWMQEAALQRWLSDLSLVAFTMYMNEQSLSGQFCLWQAFATPSGFAATYNPVETFNAVPKRDYTLRRRLKMGVLLLELSARRSSNSETTKIFHYRTLLAKALVRRASDMRRGCDVGAC
ncbi:hypothetical protein PHMEG_00028202 [Phytophthora megakarya]|uniref:MULE transposase domain-containing protein n=1 Tax=Phytophthora megakarya TaxID=4795 RepID=A0A225V5G4_9STRA|nr:hypothetical protein PHMEG_00028202 [Phytophthora megakarya]